MTDAFDEARIREADPTLLVLGHHVARLARGPGTTGSVSRRANTTIAKMSATHRPSIRHPESSRPLRSITNGSDAPDPCTVPCRSALIRNTAR